MSQLSKKVSGSEFGNRELATRKSEGFGVILCRTRKVLYNDHIFGTPPPVVGLASVEPLWEVSSFLTRLYAIIPTDVCSVKRKWSRCPPGLSYLLSNQCDLFPFVLNSYLPSNYSIWPELIVFQPTNLTANNLPGAGRDGPSPHQLLRLWILG
jgi:hypothetical protein